MGSINDGKHLLIDPTYEGVAVDFANTYRRQLEMSPDVWVAAHASQYNRDTKYKPGQPYSPDTFVDPEGYRKEIQRLQQIFLQQVNREISGNEENLSFE